MFFLSGSDRSGTIITSLSSPAVEYNLLVSIVFTLQFGSFNRLAIAFVSALLCSGQSRLAAGDDTE